MSAQICQALLVAQQATGVTLSGGKAYFYVAGSGEAQLGTIYLDRNQTQVAPNPCTLDANGTAAIYGSGLYDIKITDASNVQKFNWLGFELISQLVEAQSSNYASLNDAITAIGSTPTTLNIVTPNFPMSGIATVPSTLALNFIYPSSINNSYALTINSSFPPVNYQVFTGSGTITGLKEARPEWFGAVGDGSTDDTAAINTAIQSTNGWVRFTPGKTYIINPATAMTFASGASQVAFPMKSNMYLDLTGATLKLIDHYSTDATPKKGEFFGATTALSNIVIKGGTLDGNGANNTISPSRGSGSYNHYTQSFVIFSGDNANGSNVLLDGVAFKNTAGSSPIVMGQTSTVGATLGSGWTIKGCTFINDASDTDDMSSIYGYAENVLIDGNTFKMTSVPTFGTPTAIEIHGAHSKVVNNTVTNFYQGGWQSTNYTNDVHDVLWANNSMVVQQSGIDFEHDISTEKNLYDVSIANNIIELDDSDNRAGGAFKVGVGMRGTTGTGYGIHDISISENFIRKIGGYSFGSAGVHLSILGTGQKHNNIRITNNQISNTSYGLYSNINTGGSYGNVIFSGNKMLNLTPATGYAFPYGILVATVAASPFDYLELKGNSIVDNISAPTALATTGINLAGYVTSLNVDQNSYTNLASPYYSETSLVARYRFGAEARSLFTAYPTMGIWDIGDRIPRNTPTVGQPKAWSQTTNAYKTGSYSVTRANTTAYANGVWALWTTGTTVWEVTAGGGGNTAGSPPSIAGKNVGDTVVDGAITWTLRSLYGSTWTSEGNL